MKISGNMWSLLLAAILLVGPVLTAEPDVVVESEDTLASGDAPQQMPSPEQLLRMLEGMEGMSDKEKQELRQEILGRMNEKSDDAATEDLPTREPVKMTKPAGGIFDASFFSLVGLVGLIVTILAFFSYKLYMSLTERERKRAEKKKLKQMKKKK